MILEWLPAPAVGLAPIGIAARQALASVSPRLEPNALDGEPNERRGKPNPQRVTTEQRAPKARSAGRSGG